MRFLDATNAILGYWKLKKYSTETIRLYRDQLMRFGAWLDRQTIHDLRQVTRADITRYQDHVRAQAIAEETKAIRLRAVKRLFGFLIEDGKLLLDPTEHIKEVNRKGRLPRPVLTVAEVNRLLAAANTSLSFGVRDRALLEVLYATGARVGELVRATIHHVDLDAQTLDIRHAKGGRPRVVPLGSEATKWLKEYLTHARPRLAKRAPFERALFVAKGGVPMTRPGIGKQLARYQAIAKIKKAVTPHVLRHTCATHLLQQGADLRVIQELLGHINLKTTTLYTRVAPVDVKATHAQTHPNERRHAD